MVGDTDMYAIIGGRRVERPAIRIWEERRLMSAMRKLRFSSDAPTLEARSDAFLAHKLALGHDRIRDMLSLGLKLAAQGTRLAARLSRGGRRTSVCEIVVPRGSASAFVSWFDERSRTGDEPPMLRACPDHYIITTDKLGKQVVVETTGGSPFPMQFTIDYDDISSLKTPARADYPFQLAGVARLEDGLAVGGVRHQFRQEGDGFRALLTVEFPTLTPPHMLWQHRWHLATEFSNWIEMAAASAQTATGA